MNPTQFYEEWLRQKADGAIGFGTHVSAFHIHGSAQVDIVNQGAELRILFTPTAQLAWPPHSGDMYIPADATPNDFFMAFGIAVTLGVQRASGIKVVTRFTQ